MLVNAIKSLLSYPQGESKTWDTILKGEFTLLGVCLPLEHAAHNYNQMRYTSTERMKRKARKSTALIVLHVNKHTELNALLLNKNKTPNLQLSTPSPSTFSVSPLPQKEREGSFHHNAWSTSYLPWRTCTWHVYSSNLPIKHWLHPPPPFPKNYQSFVILTQSVCLQWSALSALSRWVPSCPQLWCQSAWAPALRYGEWCQGPWFPHVPSCQSQ